MKFIQQKPAILVLEDGTVFKGYSVGYSGTTFGEICFNTSMTGYQEIFTDPSYFGQILTMTTAHIGNYGVFNQETESDTVKISGLVCNSISDTYYSRPQGEKNLHNYLDENKVVGIKGVDVRALVRYIRSKGAMNAAISSEILDEQKLISRIHKEAPKMEGLELASKVSTEKPYFFGNPDSPIKIAVIDLGVKTNILRCLANEGEGAYLKIFPWNASYEEIMEWNPHGIMLSNGPGDPAPLTETIATVKKIINQGIPTFGICLGHQIIALASGLTTHKMHHGHRGVNHPILNLNTGTCEVTSQNHGFVVSSDTSSAAYDIDVTHTHLNDRSIAGLRINDQNTFSVQYHPESSAGPNDSRYLFKEFIEEIKKYNHI